MVKGTIVYVGGFELPDKNAASHRVLSNAKALRELGYNVIFIDIDRSLNANFKIMETKRIIQGFDCWSNCYPKTSKQWITYLTNINSIKLVNGKYDNVKAIIAYNYQGIALYNLKKFCKRNNIAIIADCTEWYDIKGTNIIFKTIKGLDSFIRMRVVQKRLDGLIVISSYLEDYYKKYVKTIRIPPLVDLNEPKWNMVNPNVADDKLKLVYTGSPGKNKDKINYIIEALYNIKTNRNYEFRVVGITKDQYINYYPKHKEIIKLLDKKIIFLGRMPHIESLAELKKSDFCIFVRDKNRTMMAGFPTKFAESISCGIPVITTNTSDLEKYIIDGQNGFFIDLNEAKKFFEKLFSYNISIIKDMKDSSANLKLFHYENYISEFEKFVDRIL